MRKDDDIFAAGKVSRIEAYPRRCIDSIACRRARHHDLFANQIEFSTWRAQVEKI
ncbi:hypothetical protein IGS74_16485 [Aureimonas sp. OT7]|uniref:hypothetical protein n=1 Tax=Aureimonas sp. OT7 TaxID=2816454 RepID=UPI001784E10C|nr:hypothetical protein [Aureimonas sp. OT7]QOG06126.1 hypothetical protein IGS74_16485 [Aureimonas sp. OT7]